MTTLERAVEIGPDPTSTAASGGNDLVKALCDEAVEQSRLAKVSNGRAKREAYARKGRALSLLLLMDRAEVDSVEFRGGRPVIGLTLVSTIPLHALPTQLTADACEIVLRQINSFFKSAFQGRVCMGPDGRGNP